jgi:3-dehydroquinate dehydratase/shikimate dehydrogenase
VTNVNREATLVASLHTAPASVGSDLRACCGRAAWLEIRADLTGDLDPDRLRDAFPGTLLYTLRSRAEGGAGDDSGEQRRKRLMHAAQRYDLVDLEAARDLDSETLSAVPASKRVISWRGAADQPELLGRIERMSATEARYYKLVTTPSMIGDELAPLAMLKALGRSDTIAFADGDGAHWTRLVAANLGAPIVFGEAARTASDGAPTVEELELDYGLPELPPIDDLFGIVGSRVGRSLSPRLHNAAFRALGARALFVRFPTHRFETFWNGIVRSPQLSEELPGIGIALRGLTVTSPFKEAAIAFAHESSDEVTRTRSTNVFLNRRAGWRAETTDPDGVLLTMSARGIDMSGKKAAVVGCGGSGRAVAAGLAKAGADVLLVNRGLERGLLANALLGLPFMRLADFCVKGFSIIVNATPVGQDGEAMPFQVDQLEPGAVVVDQVYGARPTPLMERTRSLGRVAADGREILFRQVARQFRLMNNRDMPLDPLRKILGMANGHPPMAEHQNATKARAAAELS